MAKKGKMTDTNLYYMNYEPKEEMEDLQKKKKSKERQKRIRENKIEQESEFDSETETVIQMTNRNKIKKEEEQRKKITQKESKKKKRNRKIKFILKGVLGVAIIAGGIIFAMVSPIFNIQDIQVIHNEQVSSETIISLSELKTGENIFRFLGSQIAEKIKQNAYIEEIKIHRKLPNTIQIEVEERVHKYSVDFLGKYAYINLQGYNLEIAEDSKQKPIIYGITTPEEEVKVGNRLNTEDLTKLEDVIKIMNAAKEYSLDTKVTSIDISNENEYSIYLEEEKKKVHLGDNSNLSNKMLYVNSIMEQEKGKAGDIFVNGDINNKFRTYFRESINV